MLDTTESEIEIEIFKYPESPGAKWQLPSGLKFREMLVDSSGVVNCSYSGEDIGNTGVKDGHASTSKSSSLSDIGSLEFARLSSEQTVLAEERGRCEGIKLGQALAHGQFNRDLEEERGRLHSQGAALLDSFAEERGHYLHQIEQEAVRLALAIAARIMRREAQIDPLLLTGAVRVALGQLAESTSVQLKVPEQDRQLWVDALKSMPGLRIRPLVIGEEQMKLGQCRMETDLGTADLGLLSQLREIERGFFDRLRSPAINTTQESTESWSDETLGIVNGGEL
jgi:flagellar biosynthesis/type III secretory pathway protein FliH